MDAIGPLQDLFYYHPAQVDAVFPRNEITIALVLGHLHPQQ